MLAITLDTITLDHACYEQLNATSWCATATVSSTLMAPAILWYRLPSRLAPHLDLFSSPVNCIDVKQLYWNKLDQQQPLSNLDVAYHKRQQQRNGVRLLLQSLLIKLDITDSLDDSEFPYRLSDRGYYLCFSHSDNHSQRFSNLSDHSQLFKCTLQSRVAVAISHHRAVGIDIETQSIAWPTVQRYYHANELALLMAMPKSQRDIVAKYLWQLKECFIKIYNYKLAQGLGVDYSHIISVLNKTLNDSCHTSNKLNNIIFNKVAKENKDYHVALLPRQQTLIVF